MCGVHQAGSQHTWQIRLYFHQIYVYRKQERIGRGTHSVTAHSERLAEVVISKVESAEHLE